MKFFNRGQSLAPKLWENREVAQIRLVSQRLLGVGDRSNRNKGPVDSFLLEAPSRYGLQKAQEP